QYGAASQPARPPSGQYGAAPPPPRSPSGEHVAPPPAAPAGPALARDARITGHPAAPVIPRQDPESVRGTALLPEPPGGVRPPSAAPPAESLAPATPKGTADPAARVPPPYPP